MTQLVCTCIAQTACHLARENKSDHAERLELVPKETAAESIGEKDIVGAHLSFVAKTSRNLGVKDACAHLPAR